MVDDIDKLFDRRSTFPNADAEKRLKRMVGIDDFKEKLVKSMGVLLHPEGIKTWAKKFHPSAVGLIDFLERKPPLVILAGDVGTGKTELASTIGDAIARHEGIAVTLFPLSLSTRGSGIVGEMTKLIGESFDETVNFAKGLSEGRGKSTGAVILLVDEADALVQSRENVQMHHEDRAGVNAFIRGVDRLAEQKLPAAVILCTNRLTAIDPAVKRRAAQIFSFERPNNEQRKSVLEKPLSEIDFTDDQINTIVELTGKVGGREYGFTYSDITQRFLPEVVLSAYPDKAITFEDVAEIASSIQATPPFQINV